MKRVGEILKEEREKRGLSLHEVGLSLKINHKTLKAIEDNDQTQLPAKTFLRGFIRSYAQYLRLDVDAILSQLQTEVGSTRPDDGRPKVIDQNVAPGSSPSTPANGHPIKTSPSVTSKERPRIEESLFSEKRLTYILGSTLLFVVIIFVAKTVDKYQRESRKHTADLTLEQKLAPLTTSGTLSDTAIENIPPNSDLAGQLNPPAEGASAIISLNSGSTSTLTTAAATPVTQPTAKPIIKPTPSPTVAPTVTPSLTPTPIQVVHVTPTPSPHVVVPVVSPSPTPVAPLPSGTPVVTEKLVKPVEVIVEALNKVDIRYSFDGEKFQNITLNADELYTFKSKGIVKLEVSDGGAISIIVNGRERGVPGVIGKSITLSYPK
jgi:cytoskeleton protein RodZ